MNAVERNLCQRFIGQNSELSDGQLLEQFVASCEADAFTTLLQRHGRMVFGVCQRILQNYHDAEDAFQATFLVLARKAATISPRDAVGAWLYGVACRTATKAKTMTAKRRLKELQSRDLGRPVKSPEDAWEMLLPVLDEELNRLPEMYRSAIVLCDLESRTKKEAARMLHCSEGTLSSRLVRGRRMLADRLARRGLKLSAGLLAGLLSLNAASAFVPPGLVVSTGTAAARFAASRAAAAGAVPARVAALTEGVLKTMLLSKLKVALGILAVVGFLSAALGLQHHRLQAAEAAPAQPPKSSPDKTNEKPSPQPADESLRSQIERVLKAHGGEERLEKLKCFTWNVKTSCVISPDNKDYRVFMQHPDRVRVEVNSDSAQPGQSGKLIMVMNKNDEWRKLNDNETELTQHKSEQEVAQFKLRQEYLKYIGPRAFLRLKDPAMAVSLVGERMVGDTGSLLGDRSAVCIKVSRKDAKNFFPFDEFNHGAVYEVLLYFDKDTSLLLKEEFDESNFHVEVFYSSYKAIDGVPIARKRAQRTNGEVNYKSEVEFKAEDKLDPKLFEKP